MILWATLGAALWLLLLLWIMCIVVSGAREDRRRRELYERAMRRHPEDS